MKLLSVSIFMVFYSLQLLAQYPISSNLPQQKYRAVIKENKVKSVIKDYGEGNTCTTPQYHIFDKNGFLIEHRSIVSMNGIHTFENDSLGRHLKSYYFEYPKTENYISYDIRSFDSLSNIERVDRFYANGERFFFDESWHRISKNYSEYIRIEKGQDSSVMRISFDSIAQEEVVTYFSFRNGQIISADSYYELYNNKKQKIEGGSLNYDEAFLDFCKKNPNKKETVYFSDTYRNQLIYGDSLYISPVYDEINETYIYDENGRVKSSFHYYEYKEFEYDERGFPTIIREVTKRGDLKSTLTLVYDEKGLLSKETHTNKQGKVTQVLRYQYEFH